MEPNKTVHLLLMPATSPGFPGHLHFWPISLKFLASHTTPLSGRIIHEMAHRMQERAWWFYYQRDLISGPAKWRDTQKSWEGPEQDLQCPMDSSAFHCVHESESWMQLWSWVFIRDSLLGPLSEPVTWLNSISSPHFFPGRAQTAYRILPIITLLYTGFAVRIWLSAVWLWQFT